MENQPTQQVEQTDELVTEDLIETADLIEEVSIDGMCGVY